MSTCSGCWRDDRVPGSVGVLVTTSGGPFFVVHEATPLCPTPEPHTADSCGEFEPPRPGFDPDADAPAKPIFWMRGWDDIFARLAAGASVFDILDQQIATGSVAP